MQLVKSGIWYSVLLTVLLANRIAVYGQTEPLSENAAGKNESNWNLPMRTLGGKQFWTDHLIHGDWRIQQNVVTDHYRLLDATNHRRAWGTWQQCYEQWRTLQRDESVPACKPRVVIFLHGLIRSRSSMAAIADYVAKHSAFETLCFSYASTRAPVASHAKALHDVVAHLEGAQEVDFVAHSLGNLVIRHYLHDQMTAGDGRIDPRIKRVVMLAPPNKGAQLAERLKDNPAFKLVFGVSGKQLAEQWRDLQAHLAIPPCEFGIIAAKGRTWLGSNPLLEGKDDYVVRVEETRLPGARDFLEVPGLHSFIMDQHDVQQATLKFLEHGHFVSEAERKPIPVEQNEP